MKNKTQVYSLLRLGASQEVNTGNLYKVDGITTVGYEVVTIGLTSPSFINKEEIAWIDVQNDVNDPGIPPGFLHRLMDEGALFYNLFTSCLQSTTPVRDRILGWGVQK